MIYLNTNINWEEFFVQEALDLEEKMSTLESEVLNKSKIRISLEQNILNWEKYESWITEQLGCASLKKSINENILEQFIHPTKQASEVYSNYKFWSEDLIPFFIWDNQLIVLGLQYNHQLLTIPNHILIITPPSTLSFVHQKLEAQMQKSTDNDLKFQKTTSGETTATSTENSSKIDHSKSILDGIFLDIAAPDIKFSPTISTDSTQQSPEANQPNTLSIWEFISERQEEYSFEARKLFDAFLILKIQNNKTQVFHMDSEISKEGISNLIFEYSVQEKNPFKKVFESGNSECVSLVQLDLHLAKYRYACITPLKRGTQTVGFLMGLKKDHLSEKDQMALQELAQEAA